MQTELTMMAVPSRDIPLPIIREQVEQRMRKALTDRLGAGVPARTLHMLGQIAEAIDSEISILQCCHVLQHLMPDMCCPVFIEQLYFDSLASTHAESC